MSQSKETNRTCHTSKRDDVKKIAEHTPYAPDVAEQIEDIFPGLGAALEMIFTQERNKRKIIHAEVDEHGNVELETWKR